VNSEILSKNVKNNLLHLVHSKDERNLLDRITNAIKVIDRQFFVKNKNNAYIDTALPIGYNQTISQPSTVARMLMLANLNKKDDVLELGSGSGWNGCLIAFLVYPKTVLSLDIVPQLIEQARQNLNTLKMNLGHENRIRLEHLKFNFDNILRKVDSWQDTYDKIIITAGIVQSQENIIKNLADKILKEQGILVCPYIHGPLIVLKKEKGKVIKKTTMEQYVFVPLLE